MCDGVVAEQKETFYKKCVAAYNEQVKKGVSVMTKGDIEKTCEDKKKAEKFTCTPGVDASAMGPVGLLLWCPVVAYFFFGLYVICETFFVPTLEILGNRLKMPEDVQGATLMAAGSSSPELFTSVIGAFMYSGDGENPGPGTVIGSAVFNICIIVGVSSLFTPTPMRLLRYPFYLDTICYIFGAGSLYVFYDVITPGHLDLAESLILTLIYVAYFVLLFVNERQLIGEQCIGYCCREAQGEMVKDAMRRQGMEIFEKNDLVYVLPHEDPEDPEDPMYNVKTKMAGRIHPTRPIGGHYVIINHSLALTKETENEYGWGPVELLVPAEFVEYITLEEDGQGYFENKQDGRVWTPPKPQDTPDGIDNDGMAQFWKIGVKPVQKKTIDGEIQEDLNMIDDLDIYDLRLRAISMGADTGMLTKTRLRVKLKEQFRDERRKSIAMTDMGQVHLTSDGQQAQTLDGAGGAGHDKHGDHGHGDGHDDHEHSGCEHVAHKIETIVALPYLIPMYATIPSTSNPLDFECCHEGGACPGWSCKQNVNSPWICIGITFVNCLVWLSMLTFIVVNFCSKIGACLGISPNFLGLTLLAVGSSFPDAISSILVAKQGKGDMACSNALGSNVFDLCFCLGLAFFLQSCATGAQPVKVTSGFFPLFLYMAVSLGIFMTLVFCNNMTVARWHGIILILMYVIFAGLGGTYLEVWKSDCDPNHVLTWFC